MDERITMREWSNIPRVFRGQLLTCITQLRFTGDGLAVGEAIDEFLQTNSASNGVKKLRTK